MTNILGRIRRVNILYLVLLVFYVGSAKLIGYLGLGAMLPDFMALVLSQALIFLPVLTYLLVFRVRPFRGFEGKLSVGTGLLLVLMGLCLLPCLWFLNMLLLNFTTNEIAGTLTQLTNLPLWQMVLLIGVVPAVVEETIFRGVIYGAYRQKNIWRGMILSGVLFGLLHLNWNQILYAAPLGLFLAFVLEVTGSWLAPMIVHFTINGVNAVISWVSVQALNSAEMEGMLEQAETVTVPFASYVLLFLMAAVAAAVVVVLLRAVAGSCRRRGWMQRLCSREVPVLLEVNGEPVKKNLSDIWLWIAMAVAIVVTCIG